MRMGRWYLTKQIDGTHIRQNNNKTEKLWKHATPQQQTERKKLFVSGFFCFMFGFLTNWLDSNSEDVQQIWTWTQRRKTRNLHVAMLQFNMIEPWSMDNSIRNRLETWILVTMVVRCASFQFFMGHYFCFSCVFFRLFLFISIWSLSSIAYTQHSLPPMNTNQFDVMHFESYTQSH